MAAHHQLVSEVIRSHISIKKQNSA